MSVGVLMAVRICHCIAFFLIYKPEHWIPLYNTKSCTMSMTAASFARVESVYYGFLKARCEREYKHT